MNADAFRHFYEYHFYENRKLMNHVVSQLTQEQFTQDIPYSMGSVRNQVVHMLNVDSAWFGDLTGKEPDVVDLDAEQVNDRAVIRQAWEQVEQFVRGYLAALTDDMLTQKPLQGEDENLLLWQVLLHVVNHGTDHRAQVLRAIHDFGVETPPQDYIFYVYDHP